MKKIVNVPFFLFVLACLVALGIGCGKGGGAGANGNNGGCSVDGDCDDGLWCNGAETCDTQGNCQPGGGNPCAPPLLCDEGTDSCDACNPVHSFQGGTVDLITLVIDSVVFSQPCNADPGTETLFQTVINWVMTPVSEGGLGLLKSVFMPGYEALRHGGTDNFTMSIEIPTLPAIEFEAPVVCLGEYILTPEEIFFRLQINVFVVDCVIEAFLGVTITPTSDTAADAAMTLREFSVSGPNCDFPLEPQPGCIATFNFSGAFE